MAQSHDIAGPARGGRGRTPRGRLLALALAVLAVGAVIVWLLRATDIDAGSGGLTRAVPVGIDATGDGERVSAIDDPSRAATSLAPTIEPVAPAASAPSAAAAVTLRGRVLDEAGHPIPQAGVLLVLDRNDGWLKHWTFLKQGPDAVPTHVRTGADGRFELHGEALPAGSEPRLVVHHEAFATQVRACAGFVQGDTDVGDVTLPPGAGVRGRTLDAARAPLAEADVSFSDLPGGANPREDDEVRLWFSARHTLADGLFVASGLRAAPTALRAEWRTWKGELRPVVLRDLALTAGKVLDVGDLVLEEGGVLAGVVVDDTGAAVPGASVRATKRGDPGDFDEADGLWRSSGTSNAEGEFNIAGLQPGRYDLNASKTGLSMSYLDDVSVGAQDLRLVMLRFGSLLVRVRDDAAAPVIGAQLRPTIPREFKSRPWADHQFAVESGPEAQLDPGLYRVTGAGPQGAEIEVRADGFVAQTVRAPSVGATEEVLVDVQLERALRILGVALDDTGAPVGGARVTASRTGVPLPLATTADGQGAFTLDGATPGGWTVTAKAKGYAPAVLPDLDVAASGGQPVPIQLVLVRCGALEGVASKAGVPLVGVRVRGFVLPAELPDADHLQRALRSSDADQPLRLRVIDTDARGRFRFEDLPPGRGLVWVERGADERWALAWALSGAQEDPTIASVTIHAGETTHADLAQPAGAVVRGHVLAEGAPRPGSPLALMPAKFSGMHDSPFAAAQGVADAAGAFEFEEVPPGEWRLVTQPAGGLIPLVQSFELRPGERRDADLVAAGRTLQGTVVDAASGAPLPGAEIRFGLDLEPEAGEAARLWGPNILNVACSLSDEMHDSVTTDAAGRFAVRWLPQGRYRLMTESPGFLPDSQFVAVVERIEPEAVSIALVRGATITGTLKDSALTPRSYEALLGNAGQPQLRWFSVEDGAFRFDGLEAGAYTISIFAQPDLKHALATQQTIVAQGQTRELILRLDG